MTKKEFEELISLKPVNIESVPGPDRTLLYGYDLERNTFHIYKKDGFLHKYVYSSSNKVYYNKSESFHAFELIPSKRSYPEYSDYKFCLLLMTAGQDCNFTGYCDPHSSRVGLDFIGNIYQES